MGAPVSLALQRGRAVPARRPALPRTARPGPQTSSPTAPEPRAIGLIVALSLAAPAFAQPDARTFPGNALADHTIRFEPMLWAPALRGDIKMPGGGATDVETLDADENELAPAGRATLLADKWSFLLRGYGFSVDEDAAEIDLAGFDLTAGYDLWQPINDEANEVRLTFTPFAGVRVHSLDTTIGAADADNTWFEPMAGLRVNLDLPYGFGLNVSGDAGAFTSGEDSSFSWDITVAFSWLITHNLGLEIGFRHLDMDLVEGDGADEFEFDAALAGLFGAVVIRF